MNSSFERGITITPEEYEVASGLEEPEEQPVDLGDSPILGPKTLETRLQELDDDFFGIRRALTDLRSDYRDLRAIRPEALAARYIELAQKLTDDAHFLGRVGLGLLDEQQLTKVEGQAEEKRVVYDDLTLREKTVLLAMALGKSNAAIGESLHLTEQGVKFHATRIYKKMHVSNRTEATQKAIELGFVPGSETVYKKIDIDHFTPREIDVMGLLTSGASNKKIGGELARSEQTIKYNLTIIYRKLGVENRTEAVRAILHNGFFATVEEIDGVSSVDLSRSLVDANTSLTDAVDQIQKLTVRNVGTGQPST